MDPGRLLRRALTLERVFVGLERLQAGHDPRHRIAAKPGADTADMRQLAVTINPGDQGAEGVTRGGPSADDDLMPLSAFGLAPAFAAARLIGGIEPLGDDAFQVHPAGRKQHRFAGRDEVIDVTNIDRCVVDMGLQALLSVDQRQGPQVLLAIKHLVEHEEHQVLGLGLRDGGL
jgi:hypothetical protein